MGSILGQKPRKGLQRSLLCLASFALLLGAPLAQAQEVLFGADGAAGNPAANLYTVNKVTGGVTPVGPIGFSVVGMAVHPASGVLYGVTGAQSPVSPASLIVINTTTGAGTLVGGHAAGNMSDITFDAAGTLYGWREGGGGDDLYTINIATGIATLVADSGLATGSTGLVVDGAGTLWMSGRSFSGIWDTISPVTGLSTGTLPMARVARIKGLTFDSGGVLFGTERLGGGGGPRNLVTIDLTTGVFTTIGALPNGLDALAFALVTCGDGIVDPGEECDDGNAVSGDGCDANCVIEFCGDGVVNNSGTEQCDDGNNASGDGCDANCVMEFCGDGVVNNSGTEECDDGNNASGDGCDANCVIEFCGDGVVNNGGTEQCDDGNDASGDGCDANCMIEFCGDGIVNNGGTEECDDGGESATCNADCTFVECGDGTTNATAGEECDDGGESATCDADCTFAECGDGTTNTTAGEQCDDGGETATCNADCTLAACGDGVVNTSAGEACDDGNTTDGDGCDTNCTFTACGNGIITDGEECDDGNNTDGDGCQGNCLLPFCGDGILDMGEECDDGGNTDGDGCSAACVNEGACCSDGPNTESECFIATEEVCDANGNSALFLGDGTECTADIDCVALAVEMDSMSAEATSEGVLVHWTTAMEIDTVGFRILREMPATPQNREKAMVVVADRIVAMGNSLEGANYSFLDNVRESSLALAYYIEDIDVFGRVTRHGPITIDRGEREAPTSRGGVTQQR